MAEEVDDFLEHFGVKGMKWGRRRGSDSGGSGGGSSSKPAKVKYTKEQILAARKQQSEMGQKVDEQIYKSAFAKTQQGRDIALKRAGKLEDKMINHPSAEVAAKMTKGEKVVAGLGAAAWGVAIAGLAVNSARTFR